MNHDIDNSIQYRKVDKNIFIIIKQLLPEESARRQERSLADNGFPVDKPAVTGVLNLCAGTKVFGITGGG